MPVYASQTKMNVIPYKKVAPTRFVHNFPGISILVDITRFLAQVFYPSMFLLFINCLKV